MIDRYLLRYFLAVIDHGSFSQAAAHCSVTQPTLSVGIAKLERLLDRQLFRRSSRRVELTSAGAHFAEHARRIEAEFFLAEQSLPETDQNRPIRLGVLSSIPSAWLMEIGERLSNLPEQRVELIEGREGDLLDRLNRRRIDAALTNLPADSRHFLVEPLFDEGYALAIAEQRWDGRPTLHAEDLAAEVMIVRRHCEALPMISRHFTSRGVRPFFAARTTNDDHALAWVRAGMGLTVMPDCFSASGVARPKLAGLDIRRSIGVIYQPDHPMLADRSTPIWATFEALASLAKASARDTRPA